MEEVLEALTPTYDHLVELAKNIDKVSTVGSLLRHNANSQLVSIRIGIDNVKTFAELGRTDQVLETLLPIFDGLAKVAENIDKLLETPLITSRHSRMIERDTVQAAAVYAQRSYWNTVGALLRHNMRGDLLAIRHSIDIAKDVAKAHQAHEIERILAPAYEAIRSLAEGIEEFSRELYAYTVEGKYSIRGLIQNAIKKLERGLGKPRIGLEFREGEDFEVFCSGTLEMHLYNIIDNSIYWAGQRMAKEPNHQGRVSVTVMPGPTPAADQEREFNRTCRVTVEDNGLGCPKETLDKLFYQPVTSLKTGEEGMGYALYAAANYLRGVGGSIEADSEEGEGFKVTISLPISEP